MKKETGNDTLLGKQKKYLRGLGHHLDCIVIVGREGITDNLVHSCCDALAAHELIKIKLGQNCPIDKKDAARLLAKETGAHLIQLLGKTVLLYKANPDRQQDLRIHLPS